MGNMIPHPATRPAMPAVAAILSRYDRAKLEGFIEIAIGLLDTFDGDPEDQEDDDPDTGAEDAPEGFDPEEDMCLAGDDGVFSGSASSLGLFRADDGPGDADDAEARQMEDDVPCIPVLALEPNINGQRQRLGYTLPKPLRDGTMEAEI